MKKTKCELLQDKKQKLQNELDKTEKELKNILVSSLEEKFQNIFNEAQLKINEQLKIAQKAISEAEKISEETGISFNSIVSPFVSRKYTPVSFNIKWKDLSFDIKDQYDLYSSNDGWEYWSSSSLTC